MLHRPDHPSAASWLARAKAIGWSAFGYRRSSGDLARLVHDSLVDSDATPSDHYLRFQTDDLTVHIHVASVRERTALTGRVEPPDSRTAVLHSTHTGRPLASALTTPGDFSFPAVDHGLVRVRIEAPDEPPVWSDWFRV